MDLWILNIGAHALQSLVLVTGAALAERALRHSHPAARLALWRGVLALVVALPFIQPWHSPSSTAAGVVYEVLEVSLNETGAPSPRWNASAALLVLLAGGTLIRLAWIAVGFQRLRRLRRAATPLPERPDAVRRAMADLGVGADVRLTEDSGPVSFGLRHPMVLLPRRFLEQPERAQYLVACHELLHVRRRDAVQTLLEEIAIALLWYQPWIWWLRPRLRLAREQVVDLAVARDRSTRGLYARTLLLMAGHRIPGLADAAAPRPHELRVRIDALYREVSMSRIRVAVVVTAVATIAIAGAAVFPLNGAPLPNPPTSPAAVQEEKDEPITVGGEVKPPAKTKHVNPKYPPEAKEAGIQGMVIIEAVIARDGKVASAKVIESVPELDQAALEAVLQWEFEPTYVKGKAVPVRMTVTINFRLS